MNWTEEFNPDGSRRDLVERAQTLLARADHYYGDLFKDVDSHNAAVKLIADLAALCDEMSETIRSEWCYDTRQEARLSEMQFVKNETGTPRWPRRDEGC